MALRTASRVPRYRTSHESCELQVSLWNQTTADGKTHSLTDPSEENIIYIGSQALASSVFTSICHREKGTYLDSQITVIYKSWFAGGMVLGFSHTDMLTLLYLISVALDTMKYSLCGTF